MSESSKQLEELQLLNLRLRQQLEQAELVVPALNDQIERLAGIGLACGVALFGDIVMDRANTDGSDGSVLAQAVLLVPGGFGLVLWDREEFLARRDTLSLVLDESDPRFLAFGALNCAQKAALLPHVSELTRRLLAEHNPTVRATNLLRDSEGHEF